MAILIDEQKRVMVQGITGREGITRTRLMKGYGTQIVAGVTPGRGGTEVEGVPVFDTVREACRAAGPIDISVLFIPAPLVKAAALEALEGSIKLLVIVPDRVPIYDVLEIAAVADQCGAGFIGPNTLGLVSPGRGVLGMMGGQAESAKNWFIPGPVGITSRSGGITTSMAYYLAKQGIGCTTVVHVGGDAVVGMPHAELLKCYEEDDATRLVVMYGEIGTSQEEDAAALIASGGFTKPLVACIGGRATKSGTRFSHAGAIIEGGRGAYEGKVKRLREVGAYIVEAFADIPSVTAEVLSKLGPPKAARSVRTAQIPAPQTKQRAASESDGADLHWKSAVSEVRPNEIRLRGFRIDELMGSVTFSQAIYLALTGQAPSPDIGRLIDAMLVASIDHGATPPSTLAARTAASTGASFNAALAVGLLSINQHHGGAIQACMEMIQETLKRIPDNNGSLDQAAAAQVIAYRSTKRRLPGFGHRIHTDDPRTRRLFELADTGGLSGQGIAAIRALECALAAQGSTPLPINVDGAIAAALLDTGIPPELGNTFFMMARLPGLVAQVYEEKTRERPMRQIHPTDHEYDGPPSR